MLNILCISKCLKKPKVYSISMFKAYEEWWWLKLNCEGAFHGCYKGCPIYEFQFETKFMDLVITNCSSMLCNVNEWLNVFFQGGSSRICLRHFNVNSTGSFLCRYREYVQMLKGDICFLMQNLGAKSWINPRLMLWRMLLF